MWAALASFMWHSEPALKSDDVSSMLEPPKPQIDAGYTTSNLLWPFEADASGTVFACTYLPTLVMANHSRLVAHGNCARKAVNCNGIHSAGSGYQMHSPMGLVRTNPNVEGLICQKHSDNGEDSGDSDKSDDRWRTNLY